MAKQSLNWSLAPEPWEALRAQLSLEPLSWSSAPFQKSAEAGVPSKPGVYLVCARPAASIATAGNPALLTPMYVGKASTSIRERFLSHLSGNAKPKMKRARETYPTTLQFYWAVTDQYETWEPLIYDAFGPPANDISPPRLSGFLGQPRPVK